MEHLNMSELTRQVLELECGGECRDCPSFEECEQALLHEKKLPPLITKQAD